MAQAQAIPSASASASRDQESTGITSSTPHDPVAPVQAPAPNATREAACSCLNIRLRYQYAERDQQSQSEQDASSAVEEEEQGASDAGGAGVKRVKLLQDGISVALPLLVGRELLVLPGSSSSLPLPALRCLHCCTSVYAVQKVAPSGPTRSVGFKANGAASSAAQSSTTTSAAAAASGASPSPSARGSNPQDILVRPHDGFVFLLPGALSEDQIRAVEAAEDFSPIYNVSVSLQSRPLTAALDDFAPAAAASTATPERPSVSHTQHRHSSYGQFTSASQYGLQGLPSHLISSPPSSPGTRSPTTSMSASLWMPNHANPLATHLDSAALDKLKQWRSNAEQEIMDLVRKRRRELDAMLRRARSEAKVMLETAKSVPAPHTPASLGRGNLGAEVERRFQNSPRRSSNGSHGSPMHGRSRDSSLAATDRAAADRSSSTAVAGVASTLMDPVSPLADDAFQRRPPPSSAARTGNAAANVSSSLSALSASFAMRGREAPTAMDEWAQKRRLKERYPEGDHSVMTSAATSAANSYSEQAEDDQDEHVIQEEETRGRGRQRTARNEAPSAQAAAAAAANKSGTATVAPGTTSRPTMATSSLSAPAKRPASTVVDRGNSEVGTPTPAGTLGGLASPSADVRLRPRNPPPSGAEPLKPATRKPTAGGKDAQGNSQQKGTPSGAEKKVAFAETTDQAESRAAEYSDSDEEEAKEPVDEGAAALFDIDEDIQGSDEGDADTTIGGSRKEAITAAAESIIGEEQQSLMMRDASPSPHSARSDDVDEELGGMRASVGAHHAGSFSALAASLQGRFSSSERSGGAARSAAATSLAQNEPGFDPASLRLDGRIVDAEGTSPPRQRSGSRTRTRGGGGGEGAAEAAGSDYNAGRDSWRRDWGNRGTAIGYKMAIGDAELRASGLLAPHAPSHRQLWGKERRKNEKYILEEEDDDDDDDDDGHKSGGSSVDDSPSKGRGGSSWSAWQRRAKQIESDAAAKQSAQGRLGGIAQSMPSDRGNLAVSIPTSQQRNSGSTTMHDATSGFDREPKTSLPYQERQMVPSLRKATRGAMQRKPSLPTIPDAEVSEDLTSTDFKPGRPRSDSKAKLRAGALAEASGDRSHPVAEVASTPGALPGSFIQRGFAATAEPKAAAPAAVTGNASPLTGSGFLAPGAATRGSSASVSPSGSGSASVSSGGRRSPRPPYVAPPPPASASIRLKPDPAQRPASLTLFSVPADTTFSYNEPLEEDESDWPKVLAFMHRLERLKLNRRTGWLHHRLPAAESIADHMYRMGVLAMLCPAQAGERSVDISKCVQLALVHDLAEAEVGDLTPLDGVSKAEKTQREADALAFLVHDLLGSSPAALRIEALWHEYEARSTPEARLVKDLDRFELLLQAVEYERTHDIVDLQPFFAASGEVRHPRIRKWVVELAKEREAMWREKGRLKGEEGKWAYEQAMPSDEVVVGSGAGAEQE